MKRAAHIVSGGVALVTAAFFMCLFLPVSHGAQINRTEFWDNGQVDGWVHEYAFGATLSNPGTYLQLAFPTQSILMPQEDGVAGGLDASGGAFYGDYVAIEASSIGFSIMTDGHLPAVIRLILHSAVSDREWSYAPLDLSDQAGVWVPNTVPLNFSTGKWRLSGPGASEELFLEDLKSVDRVGIRIQQNGTVAQVYCIDEFRLNGPFGSIRGKITYSGFQAGTIKVVATATASSWTSLYTTNIARSGSYELTNVRFGSNYWVKAYMDSNTNGSLDAWEAAGEFPSNALNFLVSADKVDINLSEAKSVDGLPMWWVLKNFGSGAGAGGGSAFSATADPDGDGMNNWQEYLAGTDPNSPDSVFKVDMKPSDVGIVLKWNAAYPNQKFGVWRCSNLGAGFELIKGGIDSTPPENSFEDTAATGDGPYFYKVKIE